VLILLGAFAPVWTIDWTYAPAQPDIDPIFTSAPPADLLGLPADLAASLASAAVDREDLPPPPGAITARRVKVKPGDTLAEILTQNRVPKGDAQAALSALTKIYNVRNIKPGQEVEIAFVNFNTEAGGSTGTSFDRVTIHPSVSTEIHVRRDDDGGFTAEQMEKTVERRLHAVSGAIEDSLYVSAIKLGVTPNVLMDMIRLMSWDVDFQRDLHLGDRFELMYERFYTDTGKFVRTGDVLFANLILNGKSHPLYRYVPKGAQPDYYDSTGANARKALLKTPIDGAKVSSNFGSRKHPILGYTIMHRGVDFAAPTGTPIFAAGDGMVEVRERENGYGNYVRIRHNAEFATAYGHMSRFAPRIARGSRVQQGQVIGYVGSTGMATGPHLHFEVLVKNQQVNPMTVKMPVGSKLAGADLERFIQQRARVSATFDRLVDPAAQIAQNK
jgi:murein DD-endopeptidase MepM/ murein hydrolase activator NlpD